MIAFVDLKARKKDKKWYEKVRDSVESFTKGSNTNMYKNYKKYYELLNNDISQFKEDIKQFCNPLEEFGAIEDELVPYNKLKNKLEVLNGEFLARPNNHKIMLLSAQLIQKKNDQLHSAIMESVDEDLALAIQKQQAMMQNASEEEINQIIEQQRDRLTPKDINYKNFLSEMEIYKSRVIDFAYSHQDIKLKKLKGLKDILTTDHTFVKVGVKHGLPYIRRVNPLYLDWDKASETKNIEKSDWIRELGEITVSDFFTEYSDKLEKDVIDRIMERAGVAIADYEPYMIHPNTLKYEATLELMNPKQRNHVADTDINFKHRSRRMKLVTCEFRAFRSVIFLTYFDDYGDPVTVMLDDSADIIPEHAEKVKIQEDYADAEHKYIWADEYGEYEAVIMHVPRRYEYVEIEDELVLFREDPYQPDNIDNPILEFELSYKGICVSDDNAKPQSLVENAAPYQFQIYYVKHLQNKELAAYQSFERHVDVSQVPDELAMDSEGNPIQGLDKLTQSEVIARKTRTRYFDGGQTTTGGLLPSTRSAGVNVSQLGSANELLLFQNLLTALDLELGLALGIPPAREAQAAPNTNVTDNRQSLIQASFSTQIYFYMLDYVWNKGLSEYLHLFDVCARKKFEQQPTIQSLAFEYVAPNGTKELLQVMPDQLSPSGVGIYVSDSNNDKLYMDYMLNYTHAIAQNQGQGAAIVSKIVHMISSNRSAEEINKEILLYEEDTRKRMEDAQRAEAEKAEKAKKELVEMMKFESQLKSDENVRKEEERNIGREIEAQRFALAKDIDANGMNDDLEARMYAVDKQYEIDKEKLEIEREKLGIESKKVDKMNKK